MTEIFLSLESSFDSTINVANYEFINDIAILTEATVFTEAVDDDTIMTKINKFIAKIVTAFISFKEGIKVELERKLSNINNKRRVRGEYNKLAKLKEQGIKTVETVDYYKLSQKYVELSREVYRFGKKFSNISYSHIEDLERDISLFNRTIDSYDDKLEKIADKKVKCSIDSLMKFYEDELTGRGHVFNSMNDAITLVNQIKVECVKVVAKKAIVGPDILPKHIGFIRKIILSITKFIKKWVTKIIVGSIVIFA